MAARLIFIRRTPKEIEIFGGTVFVDIDGKNIGKLSEKDLTIDVDAGRHHVKMYKSHTYGTFIGIAEVDVDVQEEKALTFRYSAPMMITQPGNIMVADFTSFHDIDKIVTEKERNLIIEKRENDYKIQKDEEESRKNNSSLLFWIFIIPTILVLICYIIEISILF